MKTLDCESLSSTYKSLEFILGLTKHELQQIFDSTDIPERVSDFADPAKELFFYIERQTHSQSKFDATCWFHCTRTWHDNHFKDGLLPLSQVIDRIWDFLRTLAGSEVADNQWKDLRQSIRSSNNEAAYRYREKFSHIIHEGPHAILIRETADLIRNDNTYVDYFKTPEIVEDMCSYCGFRLQDKFTAKTVPCVVKFIGHSPDINALHTAVMYAYRKYRRLALLPACNYCYTARGTAVPPEYILKVEHILDGDLT